MIHHCAFCRAAFASAASRHDHEQECDVVSTEKLCWYACKDRLPDDGETVLIFGSAFDEAREAFMEDGKWYLPDATPIEGQISHWATMPMGPVT
jgi:hypothetical protein